MSIELKTPPALMQTLQTYLAGEHGTPQVTLSRITVDGLMADARAARELHDLINNPHTATFLEGVRIESAHQRDRWGDAHARGKSAENWFWLVGYLAGKCLRAVITGDKEKARHHAISTAAAAANWFEAIVRDETGSGLGHDRDVRPVEIARFEVRAVPVVAVPADQYSGRCSR